MADDPCRCHDYEPMDLSRSLDFAGFWLVGYLPGCPVHGHPRDRRLVYWHPAPDGSHRLTQLGHA